MSDREGATAPGDAGTRADRDAVTIRAAEAGDLPALIGIEYAAFASDRINLDHGVEDAKGARRAGSA